MIIDRRSALFIVLLMLAVVTPIFAASAPLSPDSLGEEFLPLEQSSAVEDSSSSRWPSADTEISKARPLFTRNLRWALIAMGASITAGVLVRFKATRNMRILFLLGSIIVLGFYNGACPCPILSVMQTIRLAVGKAVRWQNLIYFLGLIPVTYIFGKVWCGWVCHMGALQEFIYLPSRINIFRSRRAQKIFRVARYLFLIGLIIWVATTGSPRWCRYDPFKVAFTQSSATTVGWVLLGLVLVSSLFVYRPFCRGACPIGLLLGLVTRIPGASVIGLKAACPSCLSCVGACRIDAIAKGQKEYSVDNEDCIACGDCIDACRLGGMDLFRKSSEHPTTYEVASGRAAGCPGDDQGTS